MVQVIKGVVTKRRILQQANRPLTAVEFVAPLAKISPIFQEEEEALKVQLICQIIKKSFYFYNNLILQTAALLFCSYFVPLELVC